MTSRVAGSEREKTGRKGRSQTAYTGASLASVIPAKRRASRDRRVTELVAAISFLTTDLGSPIPDLRCAASGM